MTKFFKTLLLRIYYFLYFRTQNGNLNIRSYLHNIIPLLSTKPDLSDQKTCSEKNHLPKLILKNTVRIKIMYARLS